MLSPTTLASSETESGKLTQLGSGTRFIQNLPRIFSPARMAAV